MLCQYNVFSYSMLLLFDLQGQLFPFPQKQEGSYIQVRTEIVRKSEV